MAERSAPTFRNYSGLWTESRAVCKTIITRLRLFRATEPKHLSDPRVWVTVESSRCADLFWLTCTLKNPPAATQPQGFIGFFFSPSAPINLRNRNFTLEFSSLVFFFIIYMCVFSRGHRLKGEALECLKHEHLQCRNLESVEPVATEFFSNTKRNIEWLWLLIKKKKKQLQLLLGNTHMSAILYENDTVRWCIQVVLITPVCFKGCECMLNKTVIINLKRFQFHTCCCSIFFWLTLLFEAQQRRTFSFPPPAESLNSSGRFSVPLLSASALYNV